MYSLAEFARKSILKNMKTDPDADDDEQPKVANSVLKWFKECTEERVQALKNLTAAGEWLQGSS